MRSLICLVAIVASVVAGVPAAAFGQGYGTDTQNILTPAAGAMAGVSVAMPQDVAAAVFGNPATLSQFQGTQFMVGGGWVEGYPTVTNDGSLNASDPGQPFSFTSRTQGFAATEIGVSQDLRSLGVPGTMGLGIAGLSGLGAEYRGRVPENQLLNNVSGEYMVLGLNMGAGVELTDRLSVGAALTLGTGFEQMGFVQLGNAPPIGSVAMVHDYALRGTFGLDYNLNECNTVGVYYQTKMSFQFPNAVVVAGDYRDLHIDQPETVGFGFANRSLMDGNLLIAGDVYYKLWENAALWQDVFVNQWAFAFGTQLTRGKNKFRLGYSYNTNPVNHNVGARLDGFPIAQSELQLFQAASTAAISQHRFTGGIGRQDFLVPNLDLDVFAGGLFHATDQFGPHTQASVAVYYVGMGLTWRYGAPACNADGESPSQQ
jgi:long-chain fatty acid transport protein